MQVAAEQQANSVPVAEAPVPQVAPQTGVAQDVVMDVDAAPVQRSGAQSILARVAITITWGQCIAHRTGLTKKEMMLPMVVVTIILT